MEDIHKICIIITKARLLKVIKVQVFHEVTREGRGVTYTLKKDSGMWKIISERGYDADSWKGRSFIPLKNTWKSVTASSSLIEGNIEHKPEVAVDGKASTAWVEGASGDGEGEWIKLEDDTLHTISGIAIINGYDKSEETYNSNNRVKKIKVEFSDGSSYTKEFSNGIFDFQSFNLEKTVQTSYVKITILEVYKGKKYRDTCISEIDTY